MFVARKHYKKLYFSAVSIQAALRGMDARNELRFRRRTTAAIIIQVIILCIFYAGLFYILFAMSHTNKKLHMTQH